MRNLKAEIQKLIDLLEQEKGEDQEVHNTLLSSSTSHERIARGFCWKPLIVKEVGYGMGDYPYVIVERTKRLDKPHQFRSGKPVSLFLANGDSEAEQISGVINWVIKDKMKIVFSCDDLPHWVERSSIGVNLLFDQKSYDDMFKALKAVKETEKGRLPELASIILGISDSANKKDIPVNLPSLNDSQNQAVSQVLGCEDVLAIHGPPGTGKTTTLVQAIRLLLKKENGILVCAPSNAASDLLVTKLAEEEINVLRIGNLSRVDEDVLEHTLEHKVGAHPKSREIKKIKKKAGEYRNIAGKYKRNFGPEEREQRRLMYREAKSMMQDANDIEQDLVDEILDGAQVIVSTLIGSNHRYIRDRVFPTVIIDEAAQALEPACWVPIIKSHKVIFAGDPFQLPPTIKSQEARKGGLEVTLMEKVIQHTEQVQLLSTQYRMNDLIMGFSNAQFYAGELKAHDSVKDIRLAGDYLVIEFVDTAGCGYEEAVNPDTFSTFNEGEVSVLQKHFEALLLMSGENFDYSIGVIAPYRAQVEILDESFSDEQKSSYDLSVNTVDSFQGQERDVIYISLVRSNDNGEIGFLKDFRRMNVAMTRAKRKLVLIGDSATLGSAKFYTDMLDYIEAAGGYRTAWEFM